MHRFALILLVSLSLLVACSRGGEDDPDNAPGIPELDQDALLDKRVDELVLQLEEQLAAADQALAARPAQEIMWPLPLHHGPLVEAAHLDIDGGPFFMTTNGLTQRGEVVLDAIEDSKRHALEPDRYHLSAIQKRLASLEVARNTWTSVSDSLNEEQRIALRDWLAQDETPYEMADQVAITLDPVQSPVPELASTWQQARKARHRAARTVAELEVLLSDGALAWMHDMRHRNLSSAGPPQRLAEGDERIRRRRMMTSFRQVATGDTSAHLESLIPAHPQYARLLDALALYREIRDSGGWPEVHPEELPFQIGARGDAVKALQERLAREGYYAGEVSGDFDRDTRAAMIAYQRTHQLGDNGVLEEADISSLNRSAAERTAQIEVTLDRWRDTRTLGDQYFLHINVPDFHAEMWRNGEMVHRFRVIVGNQSRYFSEERDEWVYINKTPLISSLLDALIFNPYWNVTPRVKRELDEKLAEDPNYYENNGYEVLSETRVRQLPGPKNVLGQVKFQFPNRYDVYMHDTDKRPLFRYPLRSFSHGCIRVEDPLELASLLFENEERSAIDWRIEQYLDGGDEDWTMLREMVPVHIEYYTVRVDEEGRAHFGADLYRYDRPLVDERLGLKSDPRDPS